MRGQRRARRGRPGRTFMTGAAIIAAAVIAAGVIIYNKSSDGTSGPLPVNLPTSTGAYVGVFAKGVPQSYAGVTAFAGATGVSPDIVMTYSGWWEPFPVGFATTAANNGAVPLVQLDPTTVSVAGVAAGRYDGYLSAYAESVRAYRHPVIISFGHEMNGYWYKWGYKDTSPKVFVAAWQHIVKLFRALGAQNVTWMWTVNIINDANGGNNNIPGPSRWWPGGSYVNWVGIDGYYQKPSWQFASLFGPTISAVKAVTPDPILIAETGADPSANQPAKIGNLFAGIQSYGLLGFVYFNATNTQGEPFVLSSPAADAAFRQGASTYHRPG
jgi:mannan endo-1,4-beta-mannosidase